MLYISFPHEKNVMHEIQFTPRFFFFFGLENWFSYDRFSVNQGSKSNQTDITSVTKKRSGLDRFFILQGLV